MLRRHLAGHGEAQDDGDQVCQGRLGGLAQGVQHAALPQQVSEHEEAYQCHAGRCGQTGYDGDDNGKENASELTNIALGVGHADKPLFFCGHQPDHRGLNDGHQGHIAVGGHHNGPQIFRAQGIGHEDGGGAVGGADHGNGGGILQVKEEPRQT